MKKYVGVRDTKNGIFEINFRPFKKAKRVFRRIKAASMQEASIVRAQEIAEAQKQIAISGDEKRLYANFAEVWESIHKNLLSCALPRKTIQRYQKVFGRLFNEYRRLQFSYVESPSQINQVFLTEYQHYYTQTLNRPNGWKAELIILKALIRRMHKLGYCTEQVVKILADMRKPRHRKKEYPDIPVAKIRELLQFIRKERPDFYPLIYFILRTGRRIEETTLIELRDVIWNGLKPIKIDIRPETTKTKESAPLDILDAELENFIRQAYNESKRTGSTFLFPNRRKQKCNQRRVCTFLKKVSYSVLGVTITPHYFRHRFFTECGKNNLPVVDVMAISGLKDPKIMINYYSHSTERGKGNVFAATTVQL